MHLPIFSKVQLMYIYISREWKCSTKGYWQSKTEASKGCDYYFSDLNWNCNSRI